MKETNSLEIQLRSWDLRRPSPRLKGELFPETEARPLQTGWSLQWLAPVAACCLLMAMIVNQVSPMGNGAGQSPNVRTLAVSNQTSTALSGTAFDSPSSNRFEWTNGSAFTSSVSSFLPGQVN